MWLSRDKDGQLNLFKAKPTRMKVNWVGYLIGTLSRRTYYVKDVFVNAGVYVDEIKGFENLSWKDEPVEVALTTVNETT